MALFLVYLEQNSKLSCIQIIVYHSLVLITNSLVVMLGLV